MMIVLRQRNYSVTMLDRIVQKLDREGLDGYDFSEKVPNDSISITTDLNNLKIYFPHEQEYSQYEVDDFIREMIPYMRTTTTLERNVYVMKLSGKLNETQYYKLVKYIIKEEEFLVFINYD